MMSLARRRSVGHDLGIGFGGAKFCLASFRSRGVETAERPYRGAATQWRSIAEQSLGFAGEANVFGIADRDQHVAQKAVAANALDCAFRKQRTEAGVVEPRQFGQLR